MKARIRDLINQRIAPTPPEAADVITVVTTEEYFTPKQVGDRLKLHPDTVRDLFRNETKGVIRVGNATSTQYKRRYLKERYSASAVERLIRRLERKADPRYEK